jgi:hypothetical protein
VALGSWKNSVGANYIVECTPRDMMPCMPSRLDKLNLVLKPTLADSAWPLGMRTTKSTTSSGADTNRS